MKFARFLIAILTIALPFAAANAQTGMVKKITTATASTEQTAMFQVLGNCGMCKSTIEKASLLAGASVANWDMEAHQLTVTFDPAKTSADAIQKGVALSGYDNVGYKAPDQAYESLHACCHYDRSGRPGTAKACEN